MPFLNAIGVVSWIKHKFYISIYIYIPRSSHSIANKSHCTVGGKKGGGRDFGGIKLNQEKSRKFEKDSLFFMCNENKMIANKMRYP